MVAGGGMRTKPLIPEMCFTTTTEEDSECEEQPVTAYLEEDGTSLLISCSQCCVRVHTSEYTCCQIKDSNCKKCRGIALVYFFNFLIFICKHIFCWFPIIQLHLLTALCHRTTNTTLSGWQYMDLNTFVTMCSTVFMCLILSGCYGVDPASVSKEWKCARCKANAMTEVSDNVYTRDSLLLATLVTYYVTCCWPLQCL